MEMNTATAINAASTDDVAPSDGATQPATKSARLPALLQRADGASIEELSSDLGWQQHTTRAALTEMMAQS